MSKNCSWKQRIQFMDSCGFDEEYFKRGYDDIAFPRSITLP